MKRLDIPQEFIPKLHELQEEHYPYEIYSYLKKINAIQLFTTLGIDIYLTFDGQVLVARYEEDEIEPRNAKNLAEVAMAIILGAEERKFLELLTLLPERPKTAVDCEICDNKSGWIQPHPTIGPFICETCGGLGWLTNDENNSQKSD
jgi:hypothetical protein